jgi:hypothetical protein
MVPKAVISSSVIPSAKYSWARSLERFSNGSTAIDRISDGWCEVDFSLQRKATGPNSMTNTRRQGPAIFRAKGFDRPWLTAGFPADS